MDNTSSGVADEDKETEAYVRRCAEKTDAELLANVGTESVAKDMDRICEAVADDKLNYVGFSYGTLLGAQYAELFPDRVRAMVLDGAVDPSVDPNKAVARLHDLVNPLVDHPAPTRDPRGLSYNDAISAVWEGGAVSAPGLPTVLVISTTGDPATPYINGVHLAEQMHAALLTVEGTQHTAAFYDIPCVDDIVAAYLIDLSRPPPDKRCSIG